MFVFLEASSRLMSALTQSSGGKRDESVYRGEVLQNESPDVNNAFLQSVSEFPPTLAFCTPHFGSR